MAPSLLQARGPRPRYRTPTTPGVRSPLDVTGPLQPVDERGNSPRTQAQTPPRLRLREPLPRRMLKMLQSSHLREAQTSARRKRYRKREPLPDLTLGRAPR